MNASTILHRTARRAMIALTAALTLAASATAGPIPLTNTKSGISLALSGGNGTDWAVERTFHDDSIADTIVYLRSPVRFSLAHNERNVITIDTPALPHVLGTAGKDGRPNSGDEGDIYFKIDRDMQAHLYCTASWTSGTERSALPPFAVKYADPVSFDSLTYDGTKKVVGAVGDNGGPWGRRPQDTTQRFAYGQSDSFGNEWHTLTYWDDDAPLLKAAGVNPHRQGASDGHCVFVCVNPKTPVLQFTASGQEQFCTTPIKTYHVPKIWEQTTYLTTGVELSFVNLTNSEPVFYRIGSGDWRPFDGAALAAARLFSPDGKPLVLDAKCGRSGVVLRRTVVCNPDYPAPSEQHGNLLWADDAERRAVARKVHSIQPFKRSYEIYRDGYYQGAGVKFDDTRGHWRYGADQATNALANAFVIAVEGPAAAAKEVQLCKARLLRVARLQPVGFEIHIDHATPAKDFLSELGQTLQCFADAGVAYDIMAAFCRKSQDPQGVTPIEEICIRESLAKIAKTILQYRDNYTASHGSGDTHWCHGYELAFGTIALAMPTYRSPYYGASGGDRKTRNDMVDEHGKYWNPFPDQGVTWYEAATDPAIKSPGYPNNAFPFRAEFLLTDDGWWSGPNDLVGDGDRYYQGPRGNQLVDVNYGGLANADCRVELVEMDGYESPFVSRLHAFDFMRRIKGDARRPLCTTNYIRRRLVHGVVPLRWDRATKTYAAEASRVETAIYAFNAHYEFASLSAPVKLVGGFLGDLKAYYDGGAKLDAAARRRLEDSRKVLYDAYALALCCDPASLPSHRPEPHHSPIIKPLFKHVVKPGEQVVKDIIAIAPDCGELTLTVAGLPPGATFDSARRRIRWAPKQADLGVYLVTVTASDGRLSTARPFVIAVSNDARRIPAAPRSCEARVAADGAAVILRWRPSAGGAVRYYLIYRDGVLWAAVPGNTLSYADAELLMPGEHTRYAVSAVAASGAESEATQTSPPILSYGIMTE